MKLTPTPTDLYFTNSDKNDPRLGEWALKSTVDSTQDSPAFYIFGYPDDEGIKLNKGRPGASAAPNVIRSFFYKMTPDFSTQKSFSLKDLGNLETSVSLADRHENGRKLVSEVIQKGGHWISLGGGHDYGYCDSSAFTEHFKTQKPVILNFDAHLDVRPSEKNLNSGTAFYRLLKEFGKSLHFIEVGLQHQCNSPHHVQWLLENGGSILWQETIEKEGMLKSLQQLVPLSPHPAFLSIDIDAFSSTIAPGCSQSWASGLDWRQFVDAFDFMIEAFDVRGIGIYEVSPPLDDDHQTSKLAALIMHRFIFNTLKKKSI